MFGASSGGSTGGFSFGSKPAGNTATTGASGFSFGGNSAGSTTTTTNPTGGLFGNSAAAKPATGFSFGSNTGASATPAATTTGGGLFGNNSAANSSTSTSTTGGLFGNKPAASTGGLFGSKPAATNSTGGLFGNNNASTATTGTGTTGGLFGNSAASAPTATTGGLFGNTAQSQPQAQAQQTQQQQPQQQLVTTSQPSFAWSQNSMTASQQQQTQPLSFSSNNSSNRINTAANSAYSQNIQEQLVKIKSSWDPNSQTTPLKTYFYNTVPENQAALYTKPENETEEWDKAYANRPNSTSIPVKAVGFEDLQKRSQIQINHVAQARVILQQISEKNKILSDKHDLDTASRIVAAKARHARISKGLLKLASTLSVLKSKGYQLSPQEEKLIENFQELLTKSQDPSGLGKSNELWARLAVLKEKAKSLSEQLDNTLGLKSTESANDSNGSNNEESNDQTQEQIYKIAKILSQQQKGIKYLDEIVAEDEKIIEKHLK